MGMNRSVGSGVRDSTRLNLLLPLRTDIMKKESHYHNIFHLETKISHKHAGCGPVQTDRALALLGSSYSLTSICRASQS